MSNDPANKGRRARAKYAPQPVTVSRRKALRDIGVFALSAPLLACSDDINMSSGSEAAGGSGATPSSSSTPPSGRSSTSAASGRAAVAMTTVPNQTGTASGGAKAASGAAGTPSLPASGTGASGATAGPSAGVSASAGAGGMPVAGAAGSPSTGAGGAGMNGANTVDLSMLDCVLTPEMTEGPFFVDEKLDKSDLVMGETSSSVTSGLPLELTLGVFHVNGSQCTAFAKAQVDIWQADVEGIYSDVAAGFFQPQDTMGEKFLRAYQVTNENGLVTFKTIYPGWYGTRTIHIHFKIRVEDPGGDAYEFTSQLYFDEAINDKVMAMAAYNTRGARTVRNMTDQVFNGTGPGMGADPSPPPNGVAPGSSTVVSSMPLASGQGYSAVLKVGVMMS